MKFRLAAFAFAAGAVAMSYALPAAAVDDDGKFLIKGVGTQPCGDYLKFNAADKLVVETWWAGYLTAYNRLTDDTYNVLKGVAPEQANTWIADYCRDNKDKLIALAVHEMLEYYFPRRERMSPNR